jgi:hypothetical protein
MIPTTIPNMRMLNPLCLLFNTVTSLMVVVVGIVYRRQYAVCQPQKGMSEESVRGETSVIL